MSRGRVRLSSAPDPGVSIGALPGPPVASSSRRSISFAVRSLSLTACCHSS